MPPRGRKRKLLRASAAAGDAARQTAVSDAARRALSRRRKWLFRLTVMIVSSLLFFTLLEVGLRLGGYGYPTTFFVGPDADGVYTSNSQFGWQFFPHSVARKPVPCRISTKPAGAVRIFVLGSSAAQGVPDPSFSVGRILEAMLRDRHPNVKFEVVNAAMTAINSHVTLEIARDCAAHQPDLFVVYMGNNEVVGPYGPATVFQKWSPNRRFIRVETWVKSTRVGQLLGDVIGWLRPRSGSPTKWRGMEMFLGKQVAADDPRLPALYDNFRQNLIDICGIARQAGAGVILSTVAVNLRDCPPFASLHRSDLSPDDLTAWKLLYQEGVELENKGKWSDAIAKYAVAAQIDDHFAELSFRLGRCFAELGRWAEARGKFASARDLDILRFRADSRINVTIREVAAEQAAAHVHLADAEQALAKSDLAVGGIPGEGLFYEHVHFTFEGNYLLARAILEQVDSALPQLAGSAKDSPILSTKQCQEALVLTLWDEYQMARLMTKMTSRPPFTNQLDHAVRQASSREQMTNLRKRALVPEALQAACKCYEAALEASPDDWNLHYRYGKLVMANGRPSIAADHFRFVLEKLPTETTVHGDLGDALQRYGRVEEAVSSYRKWLRLDPHDVDACNSLGDALNRLGRSGDAIACFERALGIDPTCVTAHNNLAAVFANRGARDEAIAHYQQALEIDPLDATSHSDFGKFLGNCKRSDEAIAHLQKAIEIDPDLASAYFNLGNLMIDCKRIDQAIVHFRTALEVDPFNLLTHNNLGVVLANRGEFDEAIVHLRKALEIAPNYPDARNNLKRVLTMRDESGRR
jgi:tetratricopeptide (TPR) repeat protein